MRSSCLCIGLLAALAACRKPESVCPEPPSAGAGWPCDTHADCIPLPDPPLGGDWNWQVEENFVGHAVFDPNSGNEILIERVAYGSNWTNSQLYSYNLSSEVLQLVFQGPLSGSKSSWGTSGWIAFTQASAPNWNIWKVKANGDSLTQLTFNGNSFRPLWSPDGTQIGYETGALGPPQYNMQNIRMTSSGTPIDTLWNTGAFAGQAVWALPNRTFNVFAWVYSCHWEGNPSTDLIYQLPDSIMQNGLPKGAAYLPGSHSMIWSHLTGLYRTDLTSGATERLLATCNSSYFMDLDYSPHTGKLLAVRRRESTPDGVILNIENDVMLMNPDGSCPQVIQIPWPG